MEAADSADDEDKEVIYVICRSIDERFGRQSVATRQRRKLSHKFSRGGKFVYLKSGPAIFN